MFNDPTLLLLCSRHRDEASGRPCTAMHNLAHVSSKAKPYQNLATETNNQISIISGINEIMHKEGGDVLRKDSHKILLMGLASWFQKLQGEKPCRTLRISCTTCLYHLHATSRNEHAKWPIMVADVPILGLGKEPPSAWKPSSKK
ncbi:hypothetical protein VNO77_23333 [Canavalia gladiata]|uniref:Uncharacterized protein n=1 Tax=Canavalia gladiata TaxID=3824 RepID=A0AAN9L9G9_CANGL